MVSINEWRHESVVGTFEAMGLRLPPILLLSCLLLVASCDDKQPKTADGEPAGRVVESTGDVSAQRPDADARDLQVDDIVFPDDTIVTADNSTVGILLTHNNARWELGSNSKRRVDQSAAFSAKKQKVAILSKREPLGTSAAGRNTTKEAATSKATLLRAQPKNETEEPKTKKNASGSSRDKKHNKRPGGRQDMEGKGSEQDQGFLRAEPTPEAMPAPSVAARAMGAGQGDDGAEADTQTTKQNSLIRARARRCHKKHGGKGTITYRFDATKGLSATGSHPSLNPLIACLRSAVPPTKNAPTVKSSLRFE